MRDTAPSPSLNRHAVASALSTMAFRTIDPDQSLNLDCEISGDEAQSLLERSCTRYGVDVDLSWSKVDFDRYFHPEQNPLLIPLFPVVLLLVAVWDSFRLTRAPGPELEPFTVDRLVAVLEARRAEAASAPPIPPTPSR